MFIPLEGEGTVSIRRVVALVRHDGETAICLRDGSCSPRGSDRKPSQNDTTLS